MTRSNLLPCGRPRTPAPSPLSDEKLEEIHSKLKNYLSAQNLKYTSQRWQIAELILKTAGHLDAGQIVEKVKSEHPSIGAATVYRAIKVLQEAGILIESHQNSQGRILFELPDDEHHDHIICTDCGEIFEFHDAQIENLQHKVAQKFGFVLKEHRHVIRGKCEFLKKKQSL